MLRISQRLCRADRATAERSYFLRHGPVNFQVFNKPVTDVGAWQTAKANLLETTPDCGEQRIGLAAAQQKEVAFVRLLQRL